MSTAGSADTAFDEVFARLAGHGMTAPVGDGPWLAARMYELDPARYAALARTAGYVDPSDTAAAERLLSLCRTRRHWDRALVASVADRSAGEASAAISRVAPGPGGDHLRTLWCVTQAAGPDAAVADRPVPPDAVERIRAMLPLIANDAIRQTAALSLLRVVARSGDAERFLAEQRPWKFRVRQPLKQVRAELVAAVARRDGLEAALAVAQRPHVRQPPLVALLAAVADRPVAEVDRWFDEHPEHDHDDHRADVMMAAFRRRPDLPDAVRDRLFEVVDGSDPDRTGGGDVRVRDGQLLELGGGRSTTSQAFIERCRRAARSPKVKGELARHLDHLRAEGRLSP